MVVHPWWMVARQTDLRCCLPVFLNRESYRGILMIMVVVVVVLMVMLIVMMMMTMMLMMLLVMMMRDFGHMFSFLASVLGFLPSSFWE